MTWNICSADDCDKKAKTKGASLCSAHYELRRLYGRLHHITERHGAHKTPEYDAWRNMRYRCTDPNHHAYKDYGGRGIDVSMVSLVLSDKRW